MTFISNVLSYAIQKTNFLAMTAHELAKKLLEGPDLSVTRRDREGFFEEIKSVEQTCEAFWNGPDLKYEEHINLD